jgi:DNA-binding protein HU-beta
MAPIRRFREHPPIRLTGVRLLMNNPFLRRQMQQSDHLSRTNGGQVHFQGKTIGGRMNKSDLIDAMAEAADIPKTSAARALDAFTDSVAVALKGGQTVSIIGFGTFSVKERAARTGRNPQTGAVIEIAASKTPSFKAGKALKDAVQ